ncbi:FAS1-like dehydratase domain-containing protein [Candidimonas nitroreducens]|uniref:FAS1-like dehydratase domain-containing protein n=1 Tax=Candidimonas nitroreducens TaxID=683354 RepID=A0A225MZ83_9BURK|nr:MaoC family dehydratase N-terminal domain-containing protein [Candidimonas nitroreducens]OWT66424.1 hypothetical protein CEY11_01440 [Candidimonas nitroreducens]
MSGLAKILAPYIGLESEINVACDRVEAGAVRRHAQAIMDEHSMYGAVEADSRYGGAVAPALFPSMMFRRPLGSVDPVQEHAQDPDYDGNVASGAAGLPPIEPLRDYATLNGGAEVELFRYVRHGEQVQLKSRYLDIRETNGRRGPMVIVVVESEYRTSEEELLLRIKRTYIRSRV